MTARNVTLIACPNCGMVGETVNNKTVRSLTQGKKVINEDTKYYLCRKPECNVAYYAKDCTPILISEIKAPIWYKNNAKPKYMCYCSKVTEDTILEAIHTKGCNTLGEVIKETGAMKQSNCIEESPTGKCCSRQIIALMESVSNNENR